MLGHDDILEELPRLLAELTGLPPEPAELHSDSGADLSLLLGGRLLVIEAKSNARAGVVSAAIANLLAAARRQGPDAVPLLVVPYMGEVGRRLCDEAGVAFVDLSGNARIVAPPLLVHVQGKPNRFVSRGRPSSVFAPKSSRAARLFLLDPKRWWLQQELAETADLGPGYVSRICKRLEEDQLLERNASRALRPRDPRILLDAWQSQYEFERHAVMRGHVSARSGDELAKRVVAVLDEHECKYAMTGLAAAWQLAPFAGFRLVSAFVRNPVPQSVLDALDWRKGDRGSNLWLVRPNDEGVFHGGDSIGRMNCVSPVQAYLDLQGMPERSDEAAEHLRKELLPWA